MCDFWNKNEMVYFYSIYLTIGLSFFIFNIYFDQRPIFRDGYAHSFIFIISKVTENFTIEDSTLLIS
jgi:hypothetical protein